MGLKKCFIFSILLTFLFFLGFGMAWGGAALANIAATLIWIIVKDLTPERLEAARAAALERMQEAHGGKCCA